MIDEAAFYGERNTAHPICGMSLSSSTDWDNNNVALFMRYVKGTATPC